MESRYDYNKKITTTNVLSNPISENFGGDVQNIAGSKTPGLTPKGCKSQLQNNRNIVHGNSIKAIDHRKRSTFVSKKRQNSNAEIFVNDKPLSPITAMKSDRQLKIDPDFFDQYKKLQNDKVKVNSFLNSHKLTQVKKSQREIRQQQRSNREFYSKRGNNPEASPLDVLT